jgi:hypothetical protein
MDFLSIQDFVSIQIDFVVENGSSHLQNGIFSTVVKVEDF